MMRTSQNPLADLVDAAAEKWLAVETAPAAKKAAIQAEIIDKFSIGDRDELTFHGQAYLLTIRRTAKTAAFEITVHEIAVADGS